MSTPQQMPPIEQWESCLVEWIWNQDSIGLYMPDGRTTQNRGSYLDVARLLTQLGSQGWEVATCAGTGNWLLWTLKRRAG